MSRLRFATALLAGTDRPGCCRASPGPALEPRGRDRLRRLGDVDRSALSQSDDQHDDRPAFLRRPGGAGRADPHASRPGRVVRPLDDTTWEFKLRRGVTFQDGSPFDAKDVVATFKRAPNVPNSPSSFAISLTSVKGNQGHRSLHDPYPDRAAGAAAAQRPGEHPHHPGESGRRHDRGFQQRQGDDRHRAVQIRRVRARRPHHDAAQRRLLGRQSRRGTRSPSGSSPTPPRAWRRCARAGCR